MKNISFEEVNKALLALLEVKSDKELYTKIAETAKSLVDADYVKLFIYKKDHLKREYSSNNLIKRNLLINDKKFNNLLTTHEIFYITSDKLIKMQIKEFPEEIKFIAVVPLLYDRNVIGFLFLYFVKEKHHLTATEREALTLYSNSAVLGLTKAKLQEESQKALEIRDRFISLASHELRTPLTSIHGYIQLLYARMKDKDTVESRWIKELYIESIRMTQLVKELLDVNRIKQGQFDFIFSEVPMLEVVSRALERYRLTNSSHPFKFQCKLNDHQSRVVGDFDKLVEMVSGLLGNAVKFSKPGATITITLKNSHGMISLVVKDTGKGISKYDLDAIFNGFYKSDQAIHIEGMGVGLLLARHIVDNHRGKLKVASRENKGTTVTISLPKMRTAS